MKIQAYDRSGNQTAANGTVEFLTAEDPYMKKGDPFWLSIDTRVFKIFESDTFATGTMLSPGQPLQFIQNVIGALNNSATPQATRDSWFDTLPSDEVGSALEYSTAITDHTTGTTRNIFNFALAKVRLQGMNGASNVRAFFRLFRYTATNLIFDPNLGYRAQDEGGTPDVKVPLLGFDASGNLISIPFFATSRVDPTVKKMTQQPTDGPYNVHDFPSGVSSEQVLYFGVWLDINQDSSRLPSTRISANPDGPFASGDLQPIRSTLFDAHCCMVVEVKYDDDPANTGDTTASSDKLSQRNLAIVQTDNPGAPITHVVEHSFQADLDRRIDDERLANALHGAPLTLVTRAEQQRRIDLRTQEKSSVASMKRMGGMPGAKGMHGMKGAHGMTTAGGGMGMMPLDPKLVSEFRDAATQAFDHISPFTFDAVDWQSTVNGIDELLFRWNELPRQSKVELYLPGVSCEDIMNLRALRHAPGDVKIIDSHRLALVPGGVTFVPLPPNAGTRIAGVVTIELPKGIRKGQRWNVDVLQLRGARRLTAGAFRISVQVSDAPSIVDAELRLLDVMFTRLSLLPESDLWHPILVRRVDTIRARAKALAGKAGVPWQDPTTWTDPHGHPHPVVGPKLRVVLERIELEAAHPAHGHGKARLRTRVRTENNGVVEQTHVLPHHGAYPYRSSHGKAVIDVDQPIFAGHAADNLSIEVAMVHGDHDRDDFTTPYRRVFCCPAREWFRAYTPTDEVIDPEELGTWRLWYRIDRG
jgi:hypothetical protein